MTDPKDTGGRVVAPPFDPALIEAWNQEVAHFCDKLGKVLQLALSPPKVELGTTPHTTIHQEGHTKVYRYTAPPGMGGKRRPPVLLVYALINKPTILDLQPGLSVVETLLSKGVDVYLLDWGTPTEMDRYLTVHDYVNGIVDRSVDAVRRESGSKRIGVLGYCMGGTFMALYTALHPEKVSRIAFLAAGLAFDSRKSFLNIWSHAPGFDADKIADTFGLVPPEFFADAFDTLDPLNTTYSKFRELILRADDKDFVENFMRMQTWTRDGIPMPGPTYAEIIKYGYQQDRLIKGTWTLNGSPVDLKRLTMPVAAITGTRDHIVPAECTCRVLDYVGTKDTARFEIDSGHIGLSVSRRAHRDLWPKVAVWFLTPEKK